MVGHIKSRATHALREQRLWNDDRPLWGEHGWNVYLESAAAVERAIRYVSNNPLKEGKKLPELVFRRSLRAQLKRSAPPIAAEAARAEKPPRRIGGAALDEPRSSAPQATALNAASIRRVRRVACDALNIETEAGATRRLGSDAAIAYFAVGGMSSRRLHLPAFTEVPSWRNLRRNA